DLPGALYDLARALEQTATRAGLAAGADDALASLVETARAAGGASTDAEGRAALAHKIGSLLLEPRSASTRREHALAARAVGRGLGIAVRAGAGAGRLLADDRPAAGIERAEPLALARDGRAWEAPLAALDAHEAALLRLGVDHARAPAATLHRE